MITKAFTIDLGPDGPIIPQELGRIFLVSNHKGPIFSFANQALDSLAIYIIWKSSITTYYPSVKIIETKRFKEWVMEPCPFPQSVPNIDFSLPRAAVASTAVFSEIGGRQTLLTRSGCYELICWFCENIKTILPGYSIPSWMLASESCFDLSFIQQAFWHKSDESFKLYCPIYAGEHAKISYLQWLRTNQPKIFKMCKNPSAVADELDSPAKCDTGEGITRFMEAYFKTHIDNKSELTLKTPIDRLIYTVWFLKNNSDRYKITDWILSSLFAPPKDIPSTWVPSGVFGQALWEQKNFSAWKDLSLKEQRQALGEFLSITLSISDTFSIPKELYKRLLLPAESAPLAEKYAINILQQSLWEAEIKKNLDDSPKSYKDCIYWILQQKELPEIPLIALEQKIQWKKLGLFEEFKQDKGLTNYSILGYEASVIGWPDGMLGIGADARITFEALAQTGLKTQQVSVSHLIPFGGSSYPLNHPPDLEPNSWASIFCLAAQDIYRLWVASPRKWWDGRYNIGLCPWELPLWPKKATYAVEMLDEIWAPSLFVAKAFANCGKLVTYMPHAIIPIKTKRDLRKELNIKSEATVFLTAFDSNASYERKNPLAVIEAFNQAFIDTQSNVKLIVKTMNAHNYPNYWQALKSANRCGDRVLFINEAYSVKEHERLLNTCDAFISLHRSEGFGRLLAEAMSIGKLLICSNFGGNTDFSTPETACLVEGKMIPVEKSSYLLSQGQEWFEADIESAATYMQDFLKYPKKYKNIMKAGKELILNQYSLEAVGNLARNTLIKRGLV